MKLMPFIINNRDMDLFNTVFLGIGVLGLALLLSKMAMADSSEKEISTARQNELIYFLKHDCGSCHGMSMKGGLGPALLPETLSVKPKGYLVTTILEGRANTAMPPWKSMLSSDEANWIVEKLQQGSLEQTDLARGNK